MEPWHAASVGAAPVEDRGPRVQTASEIADEAGMPGETIKALLAGRPADADAQLAFDYVRALLAPGEHFDALRDSVEARWGKQRFVSRSFMAMWSRNFPVLKRALGHARSCQRTRAAIQPGIVR